MEQTVRFGNISVRFPESYAEGEARRYPMLLALGSLRAGEWTDSLHGEGVLPEMIVASVESFDSAEGGENTNPCAILATMAEHCRLLDDPATHWICGAGHDGITALRAVIDHPDLFARAACLSTSFEGTEGAPPLHSPMLKELEARDSLPERTRVFFDYGTVGLDECYEPYHRDLGAILRTKGWKDGREFQIRRVQGGSHDSASWQERLGLALRWLVGR